MVSLLGKLRWWDSLGPDSSWEMLSPLKARLPGAEITKHIGTLSHPGFFIFLQALIGLLVLHICSAVSASGPLP